MSSEQVQPRVPPENVSWCISDISLEAYEGGGQILEKAHRVATRMDRFNHSYHRPICGAAVAHLEKYCVLAPSGWPACRHCWRKQMPVGVPAVFYGLYEKEARG